VVILSLALGIAANIGIDFSPKGLHKELTPDAV